VAQAVGGRTGPLHAPLRPGAGGQPTDSKPVASSDAGATVAALTRLAGPRGLKVLPVGPAIDQNAFAVNKDFAARHKLKTLSDLGASKLKIKLAAGDECPDRPFCEPGLKSTYGIDITGIDPKGVGTPQSKQVAVALSALTRTLTTEDLTELNKKVDAERMKPADAAADY
jgi:osmoprotectant transport system substrate-binding protein